MYRHRRQAKSLAIMIIFGHFILAAFHRRRVCACVCACLSSKSLGRADGHTLNESIWTQRLHQMRSSISMHANAILSAYLLNVVIYSVLVVAVSFLLFAHFFRFSFSFDGLEGRERERASVCVSILC